MLFCDLTEPYHKMFFQFISNSKLQKQNDKRVSNKIQKLNFSFLYI